MESSGSLVGVFCQNIGKWESHEMCVDSDSVAIILHKVGVELEVLFELLIGTFRLSISLGMVSGRKGHLDP